MTQSPTRLPAEALTDEQIQSLWFDACQDTPKNPTWRRHIRFARAILAANAPVAQPAGAVPKWHQCESCHAIFRLKDTNGVCPSCSTAAPKHSPEPAMTFEHVLESTAYRGIPANDARIRCARAVFDKLSAPTHVPENSGGDDKRDAERYRFLRHFMIQTEPPISRAHLALTLLDNRLDEIIAAQPPGEPR